MRLKLYTLITLFFVSFVIAMNASFSDENKFIDVEYHQLNHDARKQVDCLTQNIYYEAGSEPYNGKVAVALVTLNRVNSPKYPKDICSVVKQKTNSTCQFTWYCQGVGGAKSNDNYYESKEVALYVYANYERIHDITKGALFYHADYVNPRWKLDRTVVIGRHIFYKDREGT